MELIFNAFIGIVLLIFLVLSLAMGKDTVKGDVFGAGGFPILLTVIGFVLLILIIRQNLKDKPRVHIPMFDIKSSSGRALIMNVAALTAYLGFMDIIGFILSTFLFIIAGAKSMGYKKNIILLAFSLILTAVLVLVFGKVFYVPLPRGISVLRELSFLFY